MECQDHKVSGVSDLSRGCYVKGASPANLKQTFGLLGLSVSQSGSIKTTEQICFFASQFIITNLKQTSGLFQVC
jgi:hypothetical protein